MPNIPLITRQSLTLKRPSPRRTKTSIPKVGLTQPRQSDITSFSIPEGNVVEKYPNGKPKVIKSEPIEFIANTTIRNGEKYENKSSYIPLEIHLNPDGSIAKRIERGTFQSYFKDGKNEKVLNYKPYDKNIKEFSQGNLISEETKKIHKRKESESRSGSKEWHEAVQDKLIDYVKGVSYKIPTRETRGEEIVKKGIKQTKNLYTAVIGGRKYVSPNLKWLEDKVKSTKKTKKVTLTKEEDKEYNKKIKNYLSSLGFKPKGDKSDKSIYDSKDSGIHPLTTFGGAPYSRDISPSEMVSKKAQRSAEKAWRTTLIGKYDLLKEPSPEVKKYFLEPIQIGTKWWDSKIDFLAEKPAKFLPKDKFSLKGQIAEGAISGSTIALKYPGNIGLARFGIETLESKGKLPLQVVSGIYHGIREPKTRYKTGVEIIAVSKTSKGLKKGKQSLYEKAVDAQRAKEIKAIEKSLPEKLRKQFLNRVKATKIAGKTEIIPHKELPLEKIEGITKKEATAIKKILVKYKASKPEAFGSVAERTQVKLEGLSGDLDTAWNKGIGTIAKKELYKELKKNKENKYRETKSGIEKLNKKSNNFEHFVEFKPKSRLKQFSKYKRPTETPEGQKVMQITEANWRKLVGAYERGRKLLGKEFNDPTKNKDLKRWIEITEQLEKRKISNTEKSILFKQWKNRQNKILRRNFELAQLGKSNTKIPSLIESIMPIRLGKKGSLYKLPHPKRINYKDYLEMYKINLKYKNKYPNRYNEYKNNKKRYNNTFYTEEPKYNTKIYLNEFEYNPNYPEIDYKNEYKENIYTTTEKIIPYARRYEESKTTRIKSKQEQKNIEAYFALMQDSLGNSAKSNLVFTRDGAVNEGMYITDKTKYNKFQTKSTRANEAEVRKAVRYKNKNKFRKKGKTYIEKRYYRFDSPNERKKGGNFNIFPYVFSKGY